MSRLRAQFKKFTLKFRRPMGTSRGVLHQRDTYLLAVGEADCGALGLGECAPLPGLSPDARPDFERKLQEVCAALHAGEAPAGLDLTTWPAVRFGLEAALLDRQNGGRQRWFETEFTRGRQTLPTNGLVVMGDFDAMLQQAFEKIALGFDCIKIKVGALDFDAECELLAALRKRYPPEQITLRLDANGAFTPESALEKLERLSRFGIHSLEQPIRPGQWDELARLCERSPIAIALDEELIGLTDPAEKRELLRAVRPRYLILKPTLLGGLRAAEAWIALANEHGLGYWVTSALESNVGLNIISQWTSTRPVTTHQGLGTGQLFTANFPAPLRVERGHLTYQPDGPRLTFDSLDQLQLG